MVQIFEEYKAMLNAEGDVAEVESRSRRSKKKAQAEVNILSQSDEGDADEIME